MVYCTAEGTFQAAASAPRLKERIPIHKRYWTVRSRPKLFNGLAFAVAGFSLFYTVLTLLVLEPRIPWQTVPWGETGSAARYWLAAVPLISLGCAGLPARLGRRRPEFWAVENFLLSLLFFFLQLDKLNLAKGIDTAPWLELSLVLAGMAAYAVHALRKKQD